LSRGSRTLVLPQRRSAELVGLKSSLAISKSEELPELRQLEEFIKKDLIQGEKGINEGVHSSMDGNCSTGARVLKGGLAALRWRSHLYVIISAFPSCGLLFGFMSRMIRAFERRIWKNLAVRVGGTDASRSG
jgi:hypothetical protein